MTQEKEAFLDRWSRLKKEQPAQQPSENAVVPEAKEEPLHPLQPVGELTHDSDFAPFMNPKVDPATRRDALKKLFTDARYNIPDPFEAYSEDYTQGEPIPEQMLKAINRVRDVAVKGPEKVAEEERLAEQAKQAEQIPQAEKAGLPTQESDDVPGKQDA
ncbi:MAG TPA: DUF3306 domain-containing protein [Burkholderiales bacterium]|nr:DUF3306 domain-containing protein [Burkholderiales bacterium]